MIEFLRFIESQREGKDLVVNPWGGEVPSASVIKLFDSLSRPVNLNNGDSKESSINTEKV